ncbi:MAG TPA: FG-GAP-like repeat-containing protein, partial [Pyrinomonadaceae bacterium]|nr:FG-GAP-like repeat-containing protein [Pyrinomonadaceae bacterium]
IGLTAEATIFAQAFAPPVNYTVGSNPHACALGDLNGDGKPDIAVANNASSNISVLLGVGDGTFGTKTDYDAATGPYAVVTVDLNGDSKLDIVAVSGGFSSSQVSVFLGNGDGTFQSRVDYAFFAFLQGLPQPNSIFASDFNNDSKADVVTLNREGATVFLGNGNGTLNPPVSYGFSAIATSVAVGDFNVDGKVDLAFSSIGVSGDGVVSVMLGIGDGTFSPSVNYASAPRPYSLVKGDFNGDGKLDLATSDDQVGTISVLLGNGDGTFQAFVSSATASPVQLVQLSVGDLNSDGKSDLVAGGNFLGGLTVLKGNGDGTFQKSVSFQAGGFFASVFDLNGDGKPDIISKGQTTNSVGVLVNQTGPYNITGTVRDSNSVPLSGVTVRLTGGTPVVVNTDATGTFAFNDLTAGLTYTVTPTKTNYTFAPLNQTFANLSSNMSVDFVGTLNTYSISGTVRDISTNEMAGVTMTLSGSMSGTMVTGSDGRYSFTNLPGGGNYTVTPSLPKFMFTPPSSTSNNLSSNRVINFTGIDATYTISGSVTNVDNGSSIDNFTMVLTGTRTGTTVTSSSGYSFAGLPVDGDYTVTAYSSAANRLFTNYLLLPPASRSFTGLSSNVTANFSAKRLGFGTGNFDPLGIARGDLNGDGKLDVAVATTTGNSIHVLLGNGDGTLQSQVAYTADSNPAGVVIADFNGDGKADVASANSFGSNVSVFIGNGDGTLQTRVNYPVGSQPSNLSVGDFNGDGKNDLSVLGSPNTLSILLGNGNGTFQPATNKTIATAVFSVLSGDLNADGKLDLVTLGFPTNILVLLGRGDGTFDDAVSYPAVTGSEVVKATLADLNSDGKLDVAVASRLLRKITVLLGNGNGTFQTAITTALPTDPADLISYDFDGDTRLDLAVAGFFGGSMFLSGLGDGTFSPAVAYPAGLHSASLVPGDFNNDGKVDFALTSQGDTEVKVLLNASLTRVPGVQLGSATYSVNEGNPRVDITVTRTGDTSSSASAKFTTNDAAGLQNCNVFNGIASPRCDFIVQVGTVSFAAGEASKSFSIAITNDSYAEGNENFTVTLSNPVGGSIGTQTNATVMIVDNDGTTGTNPIEDTAFFVRQHYLDFLGREPDPPGEAAWISSINNCPPNDTSCDRIHVSQVFFQSAEFQQRGYFVYRFYPVSFGRKPDYDEFVPDLASVSGFLDDAQLEAAKVAFIAAFMERPAFISTYNFVNNTQYVDTLLNTAGVTLASRQQMIDGLNARTLTRAQVLRQIAESNEVSIKYFNQAYAVMEYFGYLRRQPDAFYLDWIAYLNGGGTPRGMVTGFVNSAEYRLRFGP